MQRPARSDPVRRQALSYDTADTALARMVDLKNSEIDCCPHCGIGLFDHCVSCNKRKNAFSRFCHACGVSASSTESHTPGAAP